MSQIAVPVPARISAAGASVIVRPARPPAWATAAAQIAGRALRKYLRTPGLLIMGTVSSALFLFMFRYVFGGAIHAGAGGYTGYLIPGYVATIVLFTGGGIAVAVAEDKAQGLTSRLLSLSIPRSALVAGRTLADSPPTAGRSSSPRPSDSPSDSGCRPPPPTRSPRSACACCTGWSSPWCSSSSACSPPMPRRPRACP